MLHALSEDDQAIGKDGFANVIGCKHGWSPEWQHRSAVGSEGVKPAVVGGGRLGWSA